MLQMIPLHICLSALFKIATSQDEVSSVFPNPPAQDQQFVCDNGYRVIDISWFCDGSEDCEDGKDEDTNKCRERGGRFVSSLYNLFSTAAPTPSPIQLPNPDPMQWISSQVVPEYIPVAPSGFLRVMFSQGVEARLGNTLTTAQTSQAPLAVQWMGAVPGTFYTLMMVDNDAPERSPRNSASPILHWLVTDIDGSSLRSLTSVSGVDRTAYFGPRPPILTGPHRYVFLIYQQSQTPVSIGVPSAVPVSLFEFRGFATNNGLVLVSGNFFRAENFFMG